MWRYFICMHFRLEKIKTRKLQIILFPKYLQMKCSVFKLYWTRWPCTKNDHHLYFTCMATILNIIEKLKIWFKDISRTLCMWWVTIPVLVKRGIIESTTGNIRRKIKHLKNLTLEPIILFNTFYCLSDSGVIFGITHSFINRFLLVCFFYS